MIKNLNNKINKNHIIILLIASVTFGVMLSTNFFNLIEFNDNLLIDSLTRYSVDKFYEILNLLTQADRTGYLLIHLIDYFYILAFYSLLTAVIIKLIKEFKTKKVNVLLFIPLIGLVADLIENISIDIHLIFFPKTFIFLAHISSVATVVKFNATTISALVIVVLSVIYLMKQLRLKIKK